MIDLTVWFEEHQGPGPLGRLVAWLHSHLWRLCGLCRAYDAAIKEMRP